MNWFLETFNSIVHFLSWFVFSRVKDIKYFFIKVPDDLDYLVDHINLVTFVLDLVIFFQEISNLSIHLLFLDLMFLFLLRMLFKLLLTQLYFLYLKYQPINTNSLIERDF